MHAWNTNIYFIGTIYAIYMSNSRDVDVWNPVRNPCTCIYPAIYVKSAFLATEEILYGVRGSLVWDESETFSSFNRSSVNFDVYHRVFRRRLGVDFSFTSGVRIRTTTKCTLSATIKTPRRTVVVQRAGRRRPVLLVGNKVTNVISDSLTI